MSLDVEDVSLNLELTPPETSTPELITAVEDAFRGAQLPFTWKVRPTVGGQSPEPALSSSPTLMVIAESASESSSLGVIGAVLRQLTAALTQVRQELPTIPLGLVTVTRSGTCWYGFRPKDSPGDIERAMGLINTTADLDSGAVGWHSTERKWVELEDKIRLTYPLRDA